LSVLLLRFLLENPEHVEMRRLDVLDHASVEYPGVLVESFHKSLINCKLQETVFPMNADVFPQKLGAFGSPERTVFDVSAEYSVRLAALERIVNSKAKGLFLLI